MLSKNFSVALVLVTCALLKVHSGQAVVINIDDGTIEGRTANTIGRNKTYYAFKSIPYAQPPVGNLRFKEPQLVESWEGILPTLNDPAPCIQPNLDRIIGQEDCLYLNVYTPQLPDVSKPLLPVMVWIYGGGFDAGTSDYNTYGPDYFLDEDVVFVSFNYRLGVFGFLSLGDLVAPGNNGMKDQNLALQWIKNNILNFGGNPDQITLFGQSAGSASVSYHLQSPLSKGLFNRVIMESGTTYCLWSSSRVAPEMAKDIAVSLNISTSSSESILAGLRRVEATQLQTAAKAASNKKYLNFNPRDGFLYAPVIEPLHSGAFMTGRSYELIQSGNFHKIPAMLGYNSLEFTMSISDAFRIFLLKFDATPSYFVPIDMNINSTDIKDSVGHQIKTHYFGSALVALSNYPVLLYVSEDQFVRPILQFAKMMANYTTTFLYQFRYEGGLAGVVNRTEPGVAHGEELGYLFRNNFTANSTDALTRSRMVKLWTNFAKYSHPTPQPDDLLQNQIWLPILPNDPNVNYFDIDYNLKPSINPNKSTMKFWTNIYDTYGKPPYDTY